MKKEFIDQQFAYGLAVNSAYKEIAKPKIHPDKPRVTQETVFMNGVLVEAQISQVIAMSAGKAILDLTKAGVPFEKLAHMQLSNEAADRLSTVAVEVHKMTGGPPLSKEFMAHRLQTVVFPLATMGTAINAIASLGDGRSIPHVNGIVYDKKDAPPPPEVRAKAAQEFLDADPRHLEIAQTVFDRGLAILVDQKKARYDYHQRLAHPDLSRYQTTDGPKLNKAALTKAALMDARGDFSGANIQKLKGGIPTEFSNFADNFPGYVDLPEPF